MYAKVSLVLTVGQNANDSLANFNSCTMDRGPVSTYVHLLAYLYKENVDGIKHIFVDYGTVKNL